MSEPKDYTGGDFGVFLYMQHEDIRPIGTATLYRLSSGTELLLKVVLEEVNNVS
jgi:hypothetical protein